MVGEGDLIPRILIVVGALRAVFAGCFKNPQPAHGGEFRSRTAVGLAHGKQATGKRKTHFTLPFRRGGVERFRLPPHPTCKVTAPCHRPRA